MDYDKTDIPDVYDLGRDHGPALLKLWMNVLTSHVKNQQIETILDLGCGTGRFSQALAEQFDAEVISIDPSTRMLEQARRKHSDLRVRYKSGSGESIPLPDRTVDLIFMSMVFHHFQDPDLVARECRRVLRADGICFLRAGTREQIASYPYVDFFPESWPILEQVLPIHTRVCEVFSTAGFHAIISDIVVQEVAPNYSAYAEKLSVGADSVLASLSAAEFESGMTALRNHAAFADDCPVFEPIDLFIFR